MTGDAVVLVSHGTVENLDDLGGFVTNVRRGRPAPAALIAELRHRYEAIGGSPLNRINGELARKLSGRLGVPVVAANRLWHPYVRELVPGLAREGIRRMILLPLAQHSVHVYADDARRAVEGTGVEFACVPSWGDRPDLLRAFAHRIATALGTSREPTTLVLTAHSLPVSVVAAGDPYERDFRAAAQAVESAVRARVAGAMHTVAMHTVAVHTVAVHTVVAFQSQGMADGPVPSEWLGPALRTALDTAKAHGSSRVVIAPIGFLADHVEVLFDLDIEARAMAAERGMAYTRSPSLNADDDFVDVLVAVAAPLLGHA